MEGLMIPFKGKMLASTVLLREFAVGLGGIA